MLTCYVYKDSDYKDVLKMIDETSPYGLTGSIYSSDEYAHFLIGTTRI